MAPAAPRLESFAGIVAGLAAVGLWLSFGPSGRPGHPPVSLIGDPAPEFSLARLARTGGTLSLEPPRKPW